MCTTLSTLSSNNCSCMCTVLSIYVRTVVQPAETRGRRRIGGGGEILRRRSLIFGFFFSHAHTRVSHIPRTHVDTLTTFSLQVYVYYCATAISGSSQYTRIYKYKIFCYYFLFSFEKKNTSIMDLTD